MSMVLSSDIKRWISEGQIIITKATFKKSCIYTNRNDSMNRPIYKYNNMFYTIDFILTYSHNEYVRLIKVV